MGVASGSCGRMSTRFSFRRRSAAAPDAVILPTTRRRTNACRCGEAWLPSVREERTVVDAPGGVTISDDALNDYRDVLWRRTRGRKITDESSATAFLREVPFSFAFGGAKVGAPTMWVAACGERDPIWPKHTHHDPYIGLVWRLKDTLVQAGATYYGKPFLRKPSFIARTWLPVALAAEPERELSPDADAVAHALADSSPLPTAELGKRIGITERKRLVAAIDEAQRAYRVAKTEERSDPFTYVWGAFDELYAPNIDEARSFDPDIARRKGVRAWLKILGAATERRLASLLGWTPDVVAGALPALVENGTAVAGVQVEGKPGVHVATAELLDGRAARG